MKHFVIFLLFFWGYENTYAQENSPSVRISGIIVDADSLDAVTFTSVTIKNTTKGTVSDNSGYFSIFANELDTLLFSNVGYETSQFVVPPNLQQENYGLVHVMNLDTLVLEEVVISPWPAPEDFERAFLSLEVQPNPDTRSMQAKSALQRTLDEQLSREKYFYDQMRYNRLYEISGEIPPNNFLNPITWSNFVKDWKNGTFQTDDDYIPGRD